MDYFRIITILLSGFTLIGCAHNDAKNPYVQPHPKPVTELATKQVAALAFISYAGESIDASDYVSNQIIEPCVAAELDRHEILQGQFSLAWGPFVHRFEGVKLDDNMMYAVWNKNNDGQLVIAIRGTNFASLSDWIDEDFYVTKTVPWKAAVSEFPGARISKATELGLNVLLKLGYSKLKKTTLADFVAEQTNKKALSSIMITGHSLAGALAPVLALRLKDTQDTWDPNHGTDDAVNISVLPIAGATPGNAQFADYYDLKLKQTTTRLHNPYDVVPQGWYLPSMRNIHNIYATGISDYRPSLLENAAIDLGMFLAKGKDYTQIVEDQPPTWGAIDTNNPTFVSQAAWQHHCGYYNGLSMNTIRDKRTPMMEVNSYCVTERYCDDNERFRTIDEESREDKKIAKMCDFRNLVKCPNVPIPPLPTPIVPVK